MWPEERVSLRMCPRPCIESLAVDRGLQVDQAPLLPVAADGKAELTPQVHPRSLQRATPHSLSSQAHCARKSV